MLTIGQLARAVGVSVKTIRVYHAKGLLPEPERDFSGYRRYTAQDAVELVKIRALAEAGVPLARIREFRSGSDAELRAALGRVADDLARRISGLQRTQERLRQLAAGDADQLPPGVREHLDRLRRFGFSDRWLTLQADLWTLVFATHPSAAPGLLRDQGESLDDPLQRQIFLDYDAAYELDAEDPIIDDLARRAVRATQERYDPGNLPGQDASSDIPALIQQAVNASSPAWRRIDTLIRRGLRS
jgi:DNA-binding transcriptional MerR regulator